MEKSVQKSRESLVLSSDKAPIIENEAIGVKIRVLVTGEESNGVYSLFEYTAPPEFPGPPLHWHKETSELFYMLDGSLEVQLDEIVHALLPGERALIPPGIVHGFSNPGKMPAKFLLHVTPGGFEQYFEEMSELVENAPTWPPKDMSPVAELAARFDTHHAVQE